MLKTSTTRLPQALREEIQQLEGDGRQRFGRKSGVSRKETRKEERIGRKKNKATFFSKQQKPVHTKRPAELTHVDVPQSKKQKIVVPQPGGTPIALESLSRASQSRKRPESNGKSLAKDDKPAKKKNNLAPPPGDRDPEDAYIEYLESKLGYGKQEKARKIGGMEDDGLDELLDFTYSLSGRQPKDDGFPGPELEESEGDSEVSDEFEAASYEDGDDASAVYFDEEDEWGGIGEMHENENEVEQSEALKDHTSTTSGRPQSSHYVPPHLRTQAPEKAEDSLHRAKLHKQLKGLLNRMSEQNIGGIVDSVEETHRGYKRNDVTTTLTALITKGIASHSSLLDSFVVLHAAFVASLYRVVGIEFAASFVQSTALLYESHLVTAKELQDGQNDGGDEGIGKECSNLLVLLAELYNFKVIASDLIFDLIRGLLEGELTELSVELLLKILKVSGSQLRIDDPSALKDIIQVVHTKIHGDEDTIRTRFMIETLTNLKNNRIKKQPANQGADAVERLKKFISNLNKKRHVLAHEPLRVTLKDLHSADAKGKWWLVGAAWAGDPLVDKQGEIEAAKTAAAADPTGNLTRLARKQGMNTDIRRSIFVVLMTSEDYVDACERLSQLKLTEVQRREIIRVLLHCCGNEKTYNPYYTLVCQHLCQSSHSYRITLQFSLWDFLRELGETSVGGMEMIKSMHEDAFDLKHISPNRVENVANAYAWWIAKDCVSLTILKPVDFTNLQSRTRDFLHQLLVQTLINSQLASPFLAASNKEVLLTKRRQSIEEIFLKGARIQHLAVGLVYFMADCFKDVTADDNLKQFVKWSSGLAIETLRTGIDVVSSL